MGSLRGPILYVYSHDNLHGRCRKFARVIFYFWVVLTADLNSRTEALNQKKRTEFLPPAAKEVQLLVPMLTFIAQFSIHSAANCQIVIGIGALNMLLRIYVIFTTLSGATRDEIERKVALRDACRSTTRILGRVEHEDVVFNHPVCMLWLDCHPQPPKYTTKDPSDRIQDRWAAWSRVETSCVMRRVIALYRYTVGAAGGDIDLETAIDLVWFTG